MSQTVVMDDSPSTAQLIARELHARLNGARRLIELKDKQIIELKSEIATLKAMNRR